MANLSTSQSLWDRARRMREEEELADAAGVEAPSALIPPKPPEPEPEGAAPAEAAAPDPTKAPLTAPKEATYEPSPPDLPDPERQPPGFSEKEIATSAGDDDQDVWARYAKMRKPPPELETPPMARERSAAFPIVGMIVDGLTNKGRNIGGMLADMANAPDTKYENWMRRAKAAQMQQGLENDYATSLRSRYSTDPENLALRKRGLDLREKALGVGQSREARLDAKQRERLDPNSQTAQQIRAGLAAMGVDTRPLQDKSIEAMREFDAGVKHLIDHAFNDILGDDKAEVAGKVATAQIAPHVEQTAQQEAIRQPYRRELAEMHQDIRAQDREAAAEIKDSERGQDFAKWYPKETEKDLGIAKLMDGIDAAGGAAPQEMAERFTNWLTQRGISEERAKPWMAKQMVLELWARQQTGAAISNTEARTFALQTGTDPLASETQVNAAYQVMEDVIKTWLRTKAAGRPGDARAIVKAGGIDDLRWLGAPEDEKPLPSARKKPAATGAAPAAEGGEAPAAAPAKKRFRNGKEVKTVKTGTSPDGEPVRVVFYVDGSNEVVP